MRKFTVGYTATNLTTWQQLSPATKVLYIALCKLEHQHGSNSGWVNRSIRQLSNDTGLSTRTITISRQQLIDVHYIQSEIADNYTSHISAQYRIIPIKRAKKKPKQII